MPERDSLGSIGWGLSSRDDYGGPNKSHSSIKNILRSIKRAPTLVKSTDRFHIKKIDNSHRNSGEIGFIRLPGKFSSKIDSDLKMDYSTFTRMNLSYQKKCMQNIARQMALSTGKRSAAHLRQSSYHEEFPDGNAYPTLKSLVENPGKHNCIINRGKNFGRLPEVFKVSKMEEQACSFTLSSLF